MGKKMVKEKMQEAIEHIQRTYYKIIDDWCQVYMAQRYKEGKSIDVGSFTLCQQNLSMAENEVGFKYWFEEGKPRHQDPEGWISVKDQPAPKDRKFLFYYHCGMGLGSWGQSYTEINGNSERTHKAYFLVLDPVHPSENNYEPFEWGEEKMIEMEVRWMSLPQPPKD